MADDVLSFTGITKRRWTGLALIWLAILMLFALLYAGARRSVINEIRRQAMGVAIAAAAALDPLDLEQVQGPGDAEKEAYRRVQDYLTRVERSNPDVRYMYTMRRSPAETAGESDYVFVVDAAAHDRDRNGTIEADEVCEPPGKPYDAAQLPALVKSWYRPDADPEISPDPPYPDLMSGYAPIRNARGQTVAIVGADITAATVRHKLLALQGVILLAWFMLSLLVTLVAQLYYHQQEALERIKGLSADIRRHNEMLRAANAKLAKYNERFRRELKLAQTVQLGFLPKTFPRQDKVAFDKYYLTCETIGGDLYDVFNLDDDRVAMYVADVAGDGVSAALISGLLKMAILAVRDRPSGAGSLQARLNQPELVLAALNDMLIPEIPDYEFITMVYAVLDIPRSMLSVASAGHPTPVVYSPRTGDAAKWDMPTGLALGLVAGTTYTSSERQVRTGDKIILYTDGVLEAPDAQHQAFGEGRFLDLLRSHGQRSPAEVVAAIRQALDAHRKGTEPGDDFSVLVAEIR